MDLSGTADRVDAVCRREEIRAALVELFALESAIS